MEDKKSHKIIILEDEEEEDSCYNPLETDDSSLIQERTNDPNLFGKTNEYIELKHNFYIIFHNNKYNKKISFRRTYDDGGVIKPTSKGITLSKK